MTAKRQQSSTAMTFLYKSSLLYHGLMTMVYHVHRRERFEEVARWVPRDAEVLDVCCGDGSLSSFLPASVGYRGLDESTAFIKAGTHRGRDLRHFNLMAEPLPVSQIVICQVSLFQFYPKVEEVVGRLFAAATERLIISESVKSFSQSKYALPKAICSWGTCVDGLNDGSFRFNATSLEALFAPYRPYLRHTAEVCAGRDWIYVFDKDDAAKSL
jgi:Methionine biosynthesis protein MetW